MVNVEAISIQAMQIIAFAGSAKSCYVEALRAFRQGNNETYNQKMEEGQQHFTDAHHAHLSLLSEEMQKNEPQITLLLAHAEDQLMAAETIHLLISELVATLQIMKEGK